MLVSNYVMIPWGENTYRNMFTLFLPRALVSLKCASQQPAKAPVAPQKRQTPGAGGGTGELWLMATGCSTEQRVVGNPGRGVLRWSKGRALTEVVQIPSLHPLCQSVI